MVVNNIRSSTSLAPDPCPQCGSNNHYNDYAYCSIFGKAIKAFMDRCDSCGWYNIEILPEGGNRSTYTRPCTNGA